MAPSPFLVSDLIRRARTMLQDEHVTYRYSDGQLIDAINDGLDEISRRRADLFMFSNFGPTYVGTIGDTISLPAAYHPVLTDLVVASMMMREDEYANDGRAASLYGAALGRLVRTVATG